ncbi:EVE domain-containing protein [Bifidobacterium sp. ESL0775]|uniref:McrB family protein n=1 Tax=Bifidobacterium sp. ESL0775 TaxID=2983230 RepID=UPI0023F8B2B5|nr:AAA family ATPase [Bifidobacterium sp. ESL0775]WEV69920.1 EVE domain-containing protein [Bifidobacterium sp. ESL0775]
MSENGIEEDESVWVGHDPGITTEHWVSLLHDSSMVTDNNLITLRCLYEQPNGLSCAQLAGEYGRDWHFYLSNISTLGEKVAKNINLIKPDQNERTFEYWTVLCLGKSTDEGQHGYFVWKLRPELRDALAQMDLSMYPLRASESEGSDSVAYWWLVASPKQWKISSLKIDEEQNYTVHNENGNLRRLAANFKAIKKGDRIVGYEASPTKAALAIFEVSRQPSDELLYFKKLRDFDEPVPFSSIKANPELSGMEFFRNMNGSLFKLSKAEYEALEEMAGEDDVSPLVEKTPELYNDRDFLNEVFLSKDDLKVLKGLLRRKHNLILQGAPGTGKTFAAKRLAYAMMGEKDESRIQSVQFHQNTSYDEFVYGYRPNDDGNGFAPVPGIFTRFVQKAKRDRDRKYFFIIDEINRANISKVFGELLSTIESDHRSSDDAVVLSITGQPFYVPDNFYIIGMMNTADRGLALIDYALRRRFAFFTMKPQLDNANFKNRVGNLGDARLLNLVKAVRELNKVIVEDDALGEGFCIGHSYFCDNQTKDGEGLAASIIEFELVPLIKEYWFDNKKQVKTQSDLLRKAIQ